MSAMITSRGSRRRSLDGLRGVAALVVLLGHVLPSVAAFSGPIHSRYHQNGWGWWFTNTPLAALWDGSSAVYVFFVLSGFVLVVGRARDRTAWLAYYPSRLLRLYVPVAGSVAIALLLTAGVHRWTPVSLHSVVRDVLLIRGVDLLNSPLWSLQWEVIFSLLLPVYVIFGRFRSGVGVLTALKAALLLVAVAVGFHTGHVSLVCLPIFALGTVLAVEHDRGSCQRVIEGLGTRWAGRWGAGVAAVALLAYSCRALVSAPGEPGPDALIVAAVVGIAGATMIVGLALYWPPLQTSLERPFAQWLGTRSFSLYLIHWPVLVTVLYAVGDDGKGTVSLIAVPLSLLAAEVFYRGVERPGHALARWAGGVVVTRAARGDTVVARGR